MPGARWRKVEKWGATFIDDTYNANPDSMIAALDSWLRHRATVVVWRSWAICSSSDRTHELHRKVFAHAMSLGIPLVIGIGELSSQCLCHLAYKDLAKLKAKFRFDVSAGDLVLLKASHTMSLGKLIE